MEVSWLYFSVFVKMFVKIDWEISRKTVVKLSGLWVEIPSLNLSITKQYQKETHIEMKISSNPLIVVPNRHQQQ